MPRGVAPAFAGRKPKGWAWASTAVPDFQGGFKRLINRFQGSKLWLACVPLAATIAVFWGVSANAQSAADPVPSAQFLVNNLWLMVATTLVIFMNAGFAMVETGLCRQKNAVNVLAKNLIVFTLAATAYWFIGYSLMYGTPVIDGFLYFGKGGPLGFFFDPTISAEAIKSDGLIPSLDFLFQAAFAGTAATIVSGSVAERIKFVDFIIFSLILTAVIYPIAGSWQWNVGSGWLNKAGFIDFAGSTVVHSVGGWAALIGAITLGPRMGKFQEGRPGALPGHNLAIATLGALILWIGWYGFNGGSVLAFNTSVPYVAVTTTLGGAAGGIAATITSWSTSGKPDLSMVINGILAGLVGVTAGCDGFGMGGSFIVGLIAGVLVVFSVYTFENLKIDDPVGACSVHLVCGIWGTLAVGLFNLEKGLFYGGGFAQLGSQILGIISYGVWTVVASVIIWNILKALLGLRVSPEEELQGLDIGEHGMEAYSGFAKDASNALSSISE